jgi:hypothetical protein
MVIELFLFSLALAGGLVWFSFYSSKRGYDLEADLHVMHLDRRARKTYRAGGFVCMEASNEEGTESGLRHSCAIGRANPKTGG